MKKTKQNVEDTVPKGPQPSYLLERQEQTSAKNLNRNIKQRRKEKAVSIIDSCFQIICWPRKKTGKV